jgi:hypothetical protein
MIAAAQRGGPDGMVRRRCKQLRASALPRKQAARKKKVAPQSQV